MSEQEYLRSGSTVVTSSRIEIDGQTFAVRNIGSVKVTRPKRPLGAVLVGLIGLSMLIMSEVWWVGLLVVGAAAAWGWQQLSVRSLVLVSGGGEVVATTSRNSGAIEALRAAIAQAISSR